MIPRPAVLILLSVPLLQACLGADPVDRDESEDSRTVATVGGEPVAYRSFLQYMSDNFGEEIEDGEEGDAIRSSLLDQFLEEELLLRAARDLNIAVSEAEVDSYLKEIGISGSEADPGETIDPEAFREKVRRGLILQKFKEQEVVSKIEVTPGEIDDYLEQQPDLLRESRTLVLRQILLDDKEEAERLHKTLVSNPNRFESLAAAHSVAPDHGQARSYREEELPLELREALLALKEGEISPVLEHAQRFLLFQMARQVEGEPLDREEVKGRVQVELFQSKVEQVLSGFIAGLKEKSEIHVNRSVLPFRYVGEHAN